MKKIILLSFVLMLLSTATVVGLTRPVADKVIAQTDFTTLVYLDPPSITGVTVDEEFTVNIRISTDELVRAWQAGLTFNATILNCTGVFEGEFLSDVGPTYWIAWTINNVAGVIELHGCSLLGNYSTTGAGRLAYVTFKVKAPGVSDLHLRDVKVVEYGTNKAVPISIIDVYTVVEVTPHQTIVIRSNSTGLEAEYESGFYDHAFNLPAEKISFKVTCPCPGFSNVTIPKTLLNVSTLDDWRVAIDGTLLGTEERIIAENDTRTSIYFTYNVGIHYIQITTRPLIASIISITPSSTNVTLGSDITIRGGINPARPNVTVTILYRYKASGLPQFSRWTTLTTLTTDSNSHFSYTWTTETAGTYEFMAMWEGDDNTLGDVSDAQTHYTDITVEEAYNMTTSGLYPDLVVLDVRDQSEYDSGHIYGAVWIPVAELEARIDELAGHENHEILVYCRLGVKSADASGILGSYNFTKVCNMLGGITAWLNAGYPVWIATVHNVNTTFNYDTIQAAIDAPQTLDGHTIRVDAGIYYEHVVVTKTVSLIGENMSNTIVDGSAVGTVMYIMANNVTISGFTVQNSDAFENGIFLGNSSYCTIRQNNITDNGNGIFGYVGIFNVFADNFIVGNHLRGIDLGWAGFEVVYNEIKGNIVQDNHYFGIHLFLGRSNVISQNNISNQNVGLQILGGCRQNVIQKNVFSENDVSICLWAYSNLEWPSNNLIVENTIEVLRVDPGENNVIYHNNFLESNPVAVSNGTNLWDDDYPSGGNYWSNYNGTDLYSGPYQNETGSDGIGDIPYVIDENNQDNYPLIGSISFFNACAHNEITYYVHTVSNSSVLDFNFNPDNYLISLNVTGPDDTVGFCRVTIPKELLWCDNPEQWQVWVNNTLIEDRNVMEDTNCTYIYFTYNQSIQKIEIVGVHVIPEFPTYTSMLLILIVLTVAIAIYKRRLPTPIH